MSKIRYKKRIMPRDGRMVNGSYQPDYSLGYEHGSDPRKWHLVPMCVRSPGGMVETGPDRFGRMSERPYSGEYLAASGAYWAGVRRGMRDHHLGNSEGEIKLGALRTKQMRALIAELQREVGEEALSKYLAKGGRVSDLVDMLNARSRSDEYRPKLTVGLRG